MTPAAVLRAGRLRASYRVEQRPVSRASSARTPRALSFTLAGGRSHIPRLSSMVGAGLVNYSRSRSCARTGTPGPVGASNDNYIPAHMRGIARVRE